MKQRTEGYLARFLPESRLSAEYDVMLLPEDRTVREIIHETSAGAEIVFLGLQVPDEPERLEALGASAILETQISNCRL